MDATISDAGLAIFERHGIPERDRLAFRRLVEQGSIEDRDFAERLRAVPAFRAAARDLLSALCVVSWDELLTSLLESPRVTLRRGDAPAGDAAAPGRPARPPEPRGRGPIRIVLADDHEIVRRSLAAMLGGHRDFEIVGQAGDGAAAVELAARLRPDVVLMDVNMPNRDGAEATRDILARCPGVKVIGLSMHEGDCATRRMIEAGAAAYVPKSSPMERLVATIRGG